MTKKILYVSFVMKEIISNLYLGNSTDARSFEMIICNKIDVIMCAAKGTFLFALLKSSYRPLDAIR